MLVSSTSECKNSTKTSNFVMFSSCFQGPLFPISFRLFDNNTGKYAINRYSQNMVKMTKMACLLPKNKYVK